MQPLNPTIFVAFDQLVDPQEILNITSVSVSKQKKYSGLTLVKEHPMMDTAEPGKWIAFTLTRTLPYDNKVVVSIGPNIASKEGPLKQISEESFSFFTVPVFAVAGTGNGNFLKSEFIYTLVT